MLNEPASNSNDSLLEGELGEDQRQGGGGSYLIRLVDD